MSKEVRQTFGIINPFTGKLYLDIIDYHITIRQLTDIKLLPNSVIESHIPEEKGEFYQVHCDSKLRRELKAKGIVTCIISMQKRTTGNYAECRINNKPKQAKLTREN